MTSSILLTSAFIVLARIVDVSLGTLRTIAVMRGNKGLSFILGFVESLIWVVVIAKVASNLDQPAYILAFSIGFALGNYVGLTIEQKLAIGQQVVRLFTRKATELVPALREGGFQVTVFVGQGKDGPVDMLLIKEKRKKLPKLLKLAKSVDEKCFYFYDDVVQSSEPKPVFFRPTGWRNQLVKK